MRLPEGTKLGNTVVDSRPPSIIHFPNTSNKLPKYGYEYAGPIPLPQDGQPVTGNDLTELNSTQLLAGFGMMFEPGWVEEIQRRLNKLEEYEAKEKEDAEAHRKRAVDAFAFAAPVVVCQLWKAIGGRPLNDDEGKKLGQALYDLFVTVK